MKMEKAVDPFEVKSELVSVIVPVYNCEAYLDRCLDSLLGQTYKNIEVLLVNDGSTDGSRGICEKRSQLDPRIRAFHAENAGPAAARNLGINHASGIFMFFLDADDFLETNALALLVEAYHEHKSDIVIGDFHGVSDGRAGAGYKGVFHEDRLLEQQDLVAYARSYLRKPNRFTLFAYSWGRLLRTCIIKDHNIRFDEDLHTFEDVAFNFDYLQHVHEVFFLKERLYNHLMHNHYLSATMRFSGESKKFFGYEKALTHIGGYLRSRYSDADIRREVGHAYVCLTIIQWVRVCGQIDRGNERTIYKLIRGMVHDPCLRNNLPFYAPTEGDSRILPFLMKLKLARLIMAVCKRKAHKRYGKRPASL